MALVKEAAFLQVDEGFECSQIGNVAKTGFQVLRAFEVLVVMDVLVSDGWTFDRGEWSARWYVKNVNLDWKFHIGAYFVNR